VPNFPYVSGQGPLVGTFAQLRKGFPPKVDAGYLKRFNIAPANESYVISILRFLGLLDEEGNRVQDATDYFFGGDDSFRAGLESTLRNAYKQLFDEMGDGALVAERASLTHWFRSADKTSDLVGQRQASTFLTLAALAGHGDTPPARAVPTKRTAAPSVAAAKKSTAKSATSADPSGGSTGDSRRTEGGGQAAETRSNVSGVGLSVRIEVNLPPGGDAGTYDAIFASIRKHLMS
jgi:hypothetical protein